MGGVGECVEEEKEGGPTLCPPYKGKAHLWTFFTRECKAVIRSAACGWLLANLSFAHSRNDDDDDNKSLFTHC